MNEEFEKEAAKRGFTRIYVGARVGAHEFYEKIGYTYFGEEYLEKGLKHRHMQKFLVD